MRLARTTFGGHSRRGAAMMTAVVAVLVLMGLGGAIMAMTLASKNEHRAAEEDMKALYLAESGISDALANMVAGNIADLGSADAPLAFDGGSYWVEVGPVAAAPADVVRLVARANYQQSRSAVEAVVQPTVGQVFQNAIYAGNSSGDPNYVMRFGGRGGQADQVHGDIYSGGGVDVGGTASIDGTIRAAGAITGASGESGVTQPVPDIASMQYETNHDFDVAQMFQSAVYQYDDAGGNAWQMPPDSPAHVFRLNPSDRTAYTSTTAKDDYFLEDPYEPVREDPSFNGSDAYHMTLSGTGSQPGPDGNNAVYYIDGNLWLHNLNTHSFKFYQPENNGFRVTFVVKGNVYIADNMFYQNGSKDGVAFIAIKDPDEPDSGNVYLGDPYDGSLRQVDSFLYAEHDFYDVNLDDKGSKTVTINGNMTAGNQVAIQRDYGNQHSKLTVNYDDRLFDGTLALPGLPDHGGGVTGYTVLSWRQVPAN